MDANDPAAALDAVIAGDDHRGLVLEARDSRTRGGQAGPAGRVQAKVLVEVVVVEAGDGRPEPVGRRRRPGAHAPALTALQQRRLRLRAGEAELPGEGPAQPRRGVLLEFAQ